MSADTVAAAEVALLKALDTGKAPPLALLLRPLYRRELRTKTMDSVIIMEIDKRGYRRYKHRGLRSKFPPPPADTEASPRRSNQSRLHRPGRERLWSKRTNLFNFRRNQL